jgi:hypothetical protein
MFSDYDYTASPETVFFLFIQAMHTRTERRKTVRILFIKLFTRRDPDDIMTVTENSRKNANMMARSSLMK